MAAASLITVKFLARGKLPMRSSAWTRQFPRRDPRWGSCRFVFDPDERNYDWLVVYDDLPSHASSRHLRFYEERLSCAQSCTLLVTGEPSSVKSYGGAFLSQFGTVLSSQEPWAIRHRDQVHQHCGLRWFYGRGRDHELDYDHLASMPVPPKPKPLSVVCSSKRQTHTLHRKRFDFVARLREELPMMDVFGHGVRPIDDKAEAIDPYRCHIAIENHRAPHHWTEKVADPLLGFALPLYAGCPDLGDDLPPESFIPLQLDDLRGSIETIRAAVEGDAWSARLEAIRHARSLILDKHNLFAILSRLIEARADRIGTDARGGTIASRQLLRLRRPTTMLTFAWERLEARWRNRG